MVATKKSYLPLAKAHTYHRPTSQVCLSVAMLTKQGKILLARQFVEMTRMKVENHLATFPKLIGTERQHNTVETSEVIFLSERVCIAARAALLN